MSIIQQTQNTLTSTGLHYRGGHKADHFLGLILLEQILIKWISEEAIDLIHAVFRFWPGFRVGYFVDVHVVYDLRR